MQLLNVAVKMPDQKRSLKGVRIEIVVKMQQLTSIVVPFTLNGLTADNLKELSVLSHSRQILP